MIPYIPRYLPLEERVDRRLKYEDMIEDYAAKHVRPKVLVRRVHLDRETFKMVACPCCNKTFTIQ